jgi:arabinofuranan 3-O-arabinosyltransferase
MAQAMTTTAVREVQSPEEPAIVLVDPCTDPLSRWWLAGAGVVWLVLSFAQSWGLIEDDTNLRTVLAPFNYIASSLHASSQLYGGSVETSGLLFPMGAFFAVTHLLHVPTWCAERIWLAALLTIGFWGLVRVAEALGIGTRSARILGGVAYCIAPIVVTSIQTSSDLLAVVLLPWMLLPLIAGSRHGSPRRSAARSGVAVALMGGGNAAVIFATFPVALIWLATRAGGPRRRQLCLWWLVAVGLAVFWWLVSFAFVGKYGFNYLPFSETSSTTTQTASGFEALRGASYWLDYYSVGGPLLPGAWTLVSAPIVIIGTATVAALGLAGLCRRIPERLFLISCLALGVVLICVGYSGALAGPFSQTVQHLLQTTLAPFRNISKFSPDVALPLALGLAWCISVPFGRGHRTGVRKTRGGTTSTASRHAPVSLMVLRVVALTAVVVAAAPFWQQNLYRPGGFTAIPRYWTQVGNWLNSHQGHENTMLVPGSSNATYTWGLTGSEPLEFLSDTSVLVRNLIPLSSQGSIQMLDAVETALDNGTSAPGLAEYLSRGGVKYVVERNDLNWGKTGAPPPVQVHQVLSDTRGLREVAAFGPELSADQAENSFLPVYESPSAAHIRAVEIFEVTAQSSVVQTYPASNPIVLSGDVGSLLPLAGAGLLTGRASILSGDQRSPGVDREPEATWIVTDGNQLRHTDYGNVRNNTSYVLSPGQVLNGADPNVPEKFQVVNGLQHETVADPVGAASVSASSFGSSYLFDIPGEGPASAFENGQSTGWVADATNRSVGQWIAISFHHKIPMSYIILTPSKALQGQPQISRVTISTDHGSVVRNLPIPSRSVRLSVPNGRSSYLRVTIDAVQGGAISPAPGSIVVGAGISHIAIPGVTFAARLKVPNDESSVFSGAQRAAPIFVFNRETVNPNLDPFELPSDDPDMARQFTLPKSAKVQITGYAVATVAGRYLEQLLDSLTPELSPSTIQASATSWFGNLPRFRPENVVDSSPLPWIAGKSDPNPSITLKWQRPRKVGSISLQLSQFTSRPTEVSITDAAGFKFSRPVPPFGGTIQFSPVTTNSLTIRFVHVDQRVGLLPDSGVEFTIPVGLRDIYVPGLVNSRATPDSKIFALPCGQGPPLNLDGVSIPTGLVATVGDILNFKPIPFVACVPKGGLSLTAGNHNYSASSNKSAFEATSVVIQSSSIRQLNPARRTATVDQWNADYRTVSVGRGPATDLAIAQNYNPGWQATLGGSTLRPIRIDGWQQGFEIPAGSGGKIVIVMAPDRMYRLFLLIGAIFLIVLGALALWPVRRRGPEPSRTRALPSIWVLLTASFVILALIAGPLALVALPLFVIARRWGSQWTAAIAFAALSVGAIAAASHPPGIGQSGAGAFGAVAQAASIVAFAAVLASLGAKGSEIVEPMSVDFLNVQHRIQFGQLTSRLRRTTSRATDLAFWRRDRRSEDHVDSTS